MTVYKIKMSNIKRNQLQTIKLRQKKKNSQKQGKESLGFCQFMNEIPCIRQKVGVHMKSTKKKNFQRFKVFHTSKQYHACCPCIWSPDQHKQPKGDLADLLTLPCKSITGKTYQRKENYALLYQSNDELVLVMC